MNKKELHKRQLINKIIDHFYIIKSKNVKLKLNQYSYKKIKKICKILKIYEKYYDETPSEAEESINYI